MPTVGKGTRRRTFPYTARGQEAAKKYAKTTGQSMTQKKKKKKY